MKIRNIKESDYIPVVSVLNDWWGGRRMTAMLQRLFFEHFKDTSFLIEKDSKVVAFLVGFVSQSCPSEAYIHFVGVHPEYRRTDLGNRLYNEFFDVAKSRGCKMVRSITSPVNKLSIQFHKKMGFHIEPGDSVVDGVQVSSNFDGPDEHRVLFVKNIT